MSRTDVRRRAKAGTEAVTHLSRWVAFELVGLASHWFVAVILMQLAWLGILAVQEPSFVRTARLPVTAESWDLGSFLIYGAALVARAAEIGPRGVRWRTVVSRRIWLAVMALWLAIAVGLLLVESLLWLVRMVLVWSYFDSQVDWGGGWTHHLRVFGATVGFGACVPGIAAVSATTARAVMLGVSILVTSSGAFGCSCPIALHSIFGWSLRSGSAGSPELVVWLLAVIAAVAFGLAGSIAVCRLTLSRPPRPG